MHEKNIYNTVMLTIVTMLYVTSLRLIYLIARSSYLYQFSAHHHLTSGKHQTIHCIFEFWFCVCVGVCVFRFRIEMKSHSVCLCLTDFTEHNALKIHLYCCNWHYFLLFHSQIIFH